MNVFVYPVSKASKYVPLTFTGIADRYEFLLGSDGSINHALAQAKQGVPTLLHIQWEEFLFMNCKTAGEADAALHNVSVKLQDYAALGGKVVLTIHNGLPHRIPFQAQFLKARQQVVDVAQCVLVHNAASASFLQQQVNIDPSKIHLLPHPSYIGTYETEETARAGLGTPSDRSILGFGTIRHQKGFEQLIDALPVDFLIANNAFVKICGEGKEAAEIRQNTAGRPDVLWENRYIPDDEAPALIRAAACVVLNYERFLTSGVAHLVISAGGIVVAPAVSQHLDLIPAVNHKFLFEQGNTGDLRRAIGTALSLSAQNRQAAMAANFEVAQSLAPAKAGERLAAIYDAILAAG